MYYCLQIIEEFYIYLEVEYEYDDDIPKILKHCSLKITLNRVGFLTLGENNHGQFYVFFYKCFIKVYLFDCHVLKVFILLCVQVQTQINLQKVFECIPSPSNNMYDR